MNGGPERSISQLPVIPDPYEEDLTPQVPGRGVADFQPMPDSHFDPADHADFIINHSHQLSQQGQSK